MGEGGNCHTFSSSSVMTMTTGPDGRPTVSVIFLNSVYDKNKEFSLPWESKFTAINRLKKKKKKKKKKNTTMNGKIWKIMLEL